MLSTHNANGTIPPELVRDTRLDATFASKDRTIHTIGTGRRSKSHREIWDRERTLGGGGYGTVYLERRQPGSGDDSPLLRAVKELQMHGRPRDGLNYIRELEALAKFSQKMVSLSLVATATFSVLL
jgi:hypothetical protein